MEDLVASGVGKAFGSRAVLSDVHLSLPAGESILVSGRSGSGKTTLFSILAGLDRPTHGSVRLGARDYSAMDEEQRARFRLEHLGLVFQDFRLIPDLTVRENVELPMKLAHRRADRAGRARRILQHLDMHTRAGEFPETLSGGEQQRVAIARALANNPDVVLADEPTANLDEENAQVVLGLLRGLTEQGRAVLIVSHDPLARRIADRHYHLRDGRLAPVRSGAAPGGGLEGPKIAP